MVWTNQQTLNFFTQPDQMAIPAATIPALNAEGIADPDDLAEFDDELIDEVVKNIRRPPGGANAQQIGAKSVKRLKITAHMIRHYNQTGRETTVANCRWEQVGKNFEIEWKALQEKKAQEEPEPPLLENRNVMTWLESFREWTRQVIGCRNTPIEYCLREPEAVPCDPNHSVSHSL